MIGKNAKLAAYSIRHRVGCRMATPIRPALAKNFMTMLWEAELQEL